MKIAVILGIFFFKFIRGAAYRSPDGGSNDNRRL